MRFMKYIMVLPCLLLWLTNGLAQKKDFPEFEKHVYKGTSGNLPYRLLIPKDYDADKSYPLVVFFHGAGERGTENLVPLTHIAPLFVNAQNREKYPCFVLVSQCPKGIRWVDTDWGLTQHDIPETPSWPLAMTLALMKELHEKYQFDENRLYVTGLSMGGFATWDIIARHPELFAAAAPVCGGADLKTAEKVKNIPLWVFHGALDTVVLPSRSRNMVKAIQQAGGSPKYTEYSNVYHGSWKPAYKDPDFLKWMFRQSK